MRWTEYTPTPQGHKIQEWEFLWFPMRIGKEWRWLEKAYVEYTKQLFYTPTKFLNE